MQNEWIDRINPVFHQQGAGIWDKGYVEVNRYLYNHEFIYFAAGVTRVVTEGVTNDCAAGYAAIIPPAMMHWSKAITGDVMRYCIHFDWEFSAHKITPSMAYVGKDKFNAALATKTPEWLPAPMPLFVFVGRDLNFFKDVQAFFAISETGESEALKRKMLLNRIICATILSTLNSPAINIKFGKSLCLVSKAKEYIEQNYKSEISIETVARIMRVTPTHLCRVMRQNLAMPPLEYMNALRIGEAKRLMAETSMNISEIALSAGFKDHNYFSRLFRKKTGVSPTAFMAKRNMG